MIETMYNGSLVTGSSEWSEGLSYCSSLSIVAVVLLQPVTLGCRCRCVWLPYVLIIMVILREKQPLMSDNFPT